MSATPARIGFVLLAYRRAIAITQPVKDRYGALARQTDDPVPTFFDNVADAQTMANQRQALLSSDRRRFRVTVNSITEPLALDYLTAMPVAALTDTQRGISTARPMLVSEITFDFGRQSAAMTLWG